MCNDGSCRGRTGLDVAVFTLAIISCAVAVPGIIYSLIFWLVTTAFSSGELWYLGLPFIASFGLLAGAAMLEVTVGAGVCCNPRPRARIISLVVAIALRAVVLVLAIITIAFFGNLVQRNSCTSCDWVAPSEPPAPPMPPPFAPGAAPPRPPSAPPDAPPEPMWPGETWMNQSPQPDHPPWPPEQPPSPPYPPAPPASPPSPPEGEYVDPGPIILMVIVIVKLLASAVLDLLIVRKLRRQLRQPPVTPGVALQSSIATGVPVVAPGADDKPELA
jgi:hypothetical protein